MTQTLSDSIELLRGGSLVSSFLGSFGSSLKETRVTATLGYLIALRPQRFCNFFGVNEKPQSVILENDHSKKGRSDILIKTITGKWAVIEAKISAEDPYEQSKKYVADWFIFLTKYQVPNSKKIGKKIRYFRWKDLFSLLKELARDSEAKVRVISQDLLRYMEEHAMIRTKNTVEIYAREINNEETLELFLKTGIYTCKYEKKSQAAEALYFAPHFGQFISRKSPKVKTGISYVARIEDIEVFESAHNFMEIIAKRKGKSWLTEHKHYLEAANENWDKYRHSLIFLKEPYLVFNPPIQKRSLQKTNGWLSRRTWTFDELFRNQVHDNDRSL